MLDETIAGVALDRTFPGLPAGTTTTSGVASGAETVFRGAGSVSAGPRRSRTPATTSRATSPATGPCGPWQGRRRSARSTTSAATRLGPVRQGAGNTKGAFVCPYHNWAYDLEGPGRDAERARGRGVRPRRVPARPSRATYGTGSSSSSRTRPSAAPATIGRRARRTARYERYRVGELRVGHRIVYEVEANWKIVHDNYNECLHCPGVHPELQRSCRCSARGWCSTRTVRTSERRSTRGSRRSRWRQVDLPTLPGSPNRLPHLLGLLDLPERDHEPGVHRRDGLHALPGGPAHTTVVSEYLFRPETMSPGFDCSDMVEFLDLVSVQDWTVCERAQRGA